MARIIIKRGREAAIRRRHPWIFSGAVVRIEGDEPRDGDIVEVYGENGAFLAVGHYSGRDIAVKILSFTPVSDWSRFWDGAIERARALREALGLTRSAVTNAYRLVNAEGDLLPGLVIDIYGDTAVMQCQTPGMTGMRQEIAAALRRTTGPKLETIFWKRSGAESRTDGKGEYLLGDGRQGIIRENGLEFFCDWEGGQKTGFYLDQRENRGLVERQATGKNVLNAFCYTGAFSVYALRGGANSVCSVDASKEALQTAARNIEHNFPGAQHREVAGDCFDFLEKLDRAYNLIILDPPAFVKHQKALKRGLQGYESINRAALRQIQAGGFVFTFSCSQLVGRDLFRRTVLQAAEGADRDVRVLAELTQAPCHPANLFHPEGEYLKGLLLYVS